jgi:hypothetical protein
MAKRGHSIENHGDPPVGLGAKSNTSGLFASYNGAELAAGLAAHQDEPGTSADGKTARHPIHTLAIVRPFAPGQEAAIDRLAELRATVSQIMETHHAQPLALWPSFLGALVVNNSIVNRARSHSRTLRQYSMEELVEHIRQDQPPTYTENVTGELQGPVLYGGKPHQRRHVGVWLRGKPLFGEAVAGITTLNNLANDEHRVPVQGALLLLGTASAVRPIPQSASQPLHEAIDAAEGLAFSFLPSPLLHKPDAR